MTKAENSVESAASVVATQQCCDVMLFNAPLYARDTDAAISAIEKDRKANHLLLMLTTLGGNPHVAYKLLRFIQDSYDNFTLLVAGECKSAGTLIAAGSNVLAVSRRADFGPLDIQLRKRDEIADNSR